MQVFRGRIGSLRKGLKSRAEFFFVDAPHLAQGEEAEIRAAGGTGDHPRAWWTWEVKISMPMSLPCARPQAMCQLLPCQRDCGNLMFSLVHG